MCENPLKQARKRRWGKFCAPQVAVFFGFCFGGRKRNIKNVCVRHELCGHLPCRPCHDLTCCFVGLVGRLLDGLGVVSSSAVGEELGRAVRVEGAWG